MACSGSHCSNHGTGTSTCSNHRSSCSTNRTLSLSSDYGVPGHVIRASDIENVRTRIRDEMSRWNLHSNYNYALRSPSSISSGSSIIDNHAEDLVQMVNDMNGGGTFGDLNGDLIEDSHWDIIRDRYNVIRQNCICNSDCACNNVCACHNDCACNYSDERLKRDIEFIEERNGLNIYNFKYLWDDTIKTGVMAQEILKSKWKDAVHQDRKGYYMVDYSMLPKF